MRQLLGSILLIGELEVFMSGCQTTCYKSARLRQVTIRFEILDFSCRCNLVIKICLSLLFALNNKTLEPAEPGQVFYK
jgi:hypothetical protein